MSDEIGAGAAVVWKRRASRCAAFFEGLSGGDWDQQVYLDRIGLEGARPAGPFCLGRENVRRVHRRIVAGRRGRAGRLRPQCLQRIRGPSARPAVERRAPVGLRRARADSLAIVASLTSGDLDRRGRHPWFGETDLRSVLKLLYRHPMIHLRDARRALKTGMAVEPSDDEPAEEGTSA